jgi:ATP-dependent RNA helicase RhlE
MTFQDLNLVEPLQRALETEGYTSPTPIQTQAIPHVLAGRDLIACAQTGTGKTAAFALPILQRLDAMRAAGAPKGIRALILTPTRELAAQITESLTTYGKNLRLRHAVVFGGVGAYGQVRALEARPDILVATPGRLLDLASEGFVDLRALEVFVLDEADRMLDMGFLPDVKRVLARLPAKRQTLLFSATMPTDIEELARRILVDPIRIAVVPVSTTADRIDQSVYFVSRDGKRALLEHVLKDATIERALVFTRTKHGADKVVKMLERASIFAEAIHGNKSQNARTRALLAFREGRTRVLVATDIAARGIDVDGVSHVINFDLPDVAECYVHRIGRTARAGASGIALSFCDHDERGLLTGIERLIRMRIPVLASPAGLTSSAPPLGDIAPAQQSSNARPEASRWGGGGGGSGRRRGGPSQYRGSRSY